MLVEVAKRLNDAVRRDDLIVRWGGVALRVTASIGCARFPLPPYNTGAALRDVEADFDRAWHEGRVTLLQPLGPEPMAVPRVAVA